MSYIKNLQTLRKEVQNEAPVEVSIEPINPKGFMASPNRSSQPVNNPQTPEYEPLDFTRKSLSALYGAKKDFDEQMERLSKQNESSAAETSSVAKAAGKKAAGIMKKPEEIEEGGSAKIDLDTLYAGSGTGGSASAGPLQANLSDYDVDPRELEAVAQSIKDIESGGGNYQARGPVIEKGRYKGERALGAYQVMPGNLPQWSRAALGRVVSEEEFLASKEIQDQIFLDQMMKSYKKYGSFDDAASVWFTGQPVARSGGRSDGYKKSEDYLADFRAGVRKYGGAA